MYQTEAKRNGSTRSFDARLNDKAIRNGLLAKPLRAHVRDTNTLVVHELGLAHARRRVDLAVINGVVHGFEIKSALDSLDRLPDQLRTYCQSLQKLTIVVADRHMDSVLERVPDWCGVWRAYRGPRGATRFEIRRRASRNPSVDRFILAHLLWRDEAQAILAGQGASKAQLRAPRAALYKALVEMVTEAQLTAHIKSAMRRRRDWRDHSRS